MKRIIISIKNTMLAQAVEYNLTKCGEFTAERVLSDNSEDICEACVALNANILLMDITHSPSCNAESRQKTIENVKRRVAGIKIALCCDSNSTPDIAEQVKHAKAIGQIDVFFYESVTAGYLVDVLDSL